MHLLGGFFAKRRRFLPGGFVTTDAGTGLVHMAPDHGEDDFELCKHYGIEPVFAVDAAGMYRADWGWLGGNGSVINKMFDSRRRADLPRPAARPGRCCRRATTTGTAIRIRGGRRRR